MTERADRFVVAAVTLCLFPAGLNAETRPRYGGTIEATLLGAPVSFDPIAVGSHADQTTVELLFDTLYRVGPSGNVQPHVAAGMPAIDGPRPIARVTIRKGVRFHDGAEVTAADVAASLERARQAAGSRWALAPVTGVRADGDAVELALSAPQSDALIASLLALPQTAITRGGKPPGERAIGTGAFALSQVDRTKRYLVLRAFDDHFGGRPYIDQLMLRWYDKPHDETDRFETGAAQLSARGAARFAGSQPLFRTGDVEGPAALLVYVGFGRAHADVTASESFRLALDLALARDALRSVSSGERVAPTREPIPIEAGAAAMSAPVGSGDVTAAQAALVAAAIRVKALEAPRLPALRLEILIEDTRPDDRGIAERVARALTKLGIGSVITAVPAATLRERVARGATDLWIGQLVAPVTNATMWWNAAFAAGGSDWARTRIANGTFDPALAKKEFAVRLPIVPLMFRSVRLWHRSDIHGLSFDGSGRPCFAEMFLFGDPARTRGKP